MTIQNSLRELIIFLLSVDSVDDVNYIGADVTGSQLSIYKDPVNFTSYELLLEQSPCQLSFNDICVCVLRPDFTDLKHELCNGIVL